MSYDQKYELQQFVFPKGATYNKENNRVRTPEAHLLFELTKRTTGLCEYKKSGKLSQNEMDSALVDLSVLISNFFFEIIIICQSFIYLTLLLRNTLC